MASTTRDRDNMSKRMIDCEKDMKELRLELRSTRDQLAAAKIRARKSGVMNPPRKTHLSSAQSSSVSSSSTSARSRPISTNGRKTNLANKSVNSHEPAKVPNSADVSKTREEIQHLLETHDPGKVDKLDELMEKFKGKEIRLLNKIKARYSSPATNRSQTPDSISPAVKKRADLAMARHSERMRKIREAKK